MSWFDILKVDVRRKWRKNQLHPLVIEALEANLKARGKIATRTLMDIGVYAIQDHNDSIRGVEGTKGKRVNTDKYPSHTAVSVWANNHPKLRKDKLGQNVAWVWIGAI